MIRRTSGRSGVVLPRDRRPHGRFFINNSEQECRAQGLPTQRHVTTTASCRLCNWPLVRVSVGVSKAVPTRPLNNHHVEVLFCRQTRTYTPIPCGKRRTKTCNTISPSFVLAPFFPTKRGPFNGPLITGVLCPGRRAAAASAAEVDTAAPAWHGCTTAAAARRRTMTTRGGNRGRRGCSSNSSSYSPNNRGGQLQQPYNGAASQHPQQGWGKTWGQTRGGREGGVGWGGGAVSLRQQQQQPSMQKQPHQSNWQQQRRRWSKQQQQQQLSS